MNPLSPILLHLISKSHRKPSSLIEGEVVAVETSENVGGYGSLLRVWIPNYGICDLTPSKQAWEKDENVPERNPRKLLAVLRSLAIVVLVVLPPTKGGQNGVTPLPLVLPPLLLLTTHPRLFCHWCYIPHSSLSVRAHPIPTSSSSPWCGG